MRKSFIWVILWLYTEFQCPPIIGTGQQVCGGTITYLTVQLLLKLSKNNGNGIHMSPMFQPAVEESHVEIMSNKEMANMITTETTHSEEATELKLQETAETGQKWNILL